MVSALLDDGPQCTERAVVVIGAEFHRLGRHLGDVFFPLGMTAPTQSAGGDGQSLPILKKRARRADVADQRSDDLDV